MQKDQITAVYSKVIPDTVSAAEWKKAPAVDLVWVRPDPFDNWSEERKKAVGEYLREGAQARLLWNEEYLAIGMNMVDSDVIAEGSEADNGTLLYFKGDLVEIFLKPVDKPYYWELYGTPNNGKTVIFYPSRGRLFLPSDIQQDPNQIQVHAEVLGTLNDWTDRDQGWNIVMKVPLAMLTKYGQEFRSEAWTIMIGRQNYSVHLPMREDSFYPELATSDFHNTEDYALLHLEK